MNTRILESLNTPVLQFIKSSILHFFNSSGILLLLSSSIIRARCLIQRPLRQFPRTSCVLLKSGASKIVSASWRYACSFVPLAWFPCVKARTAVETSWNWQLTSIQSLFGPAHLVIGVSQVIPLLWKLHLCLHPVIFLAHTSSAPGPPPCSRSPLDDHT